MTVSNTNTLNCPKCNIQVSTNNTISRFIIPTIDQCHVLCDHCNLKIHCFRFYNFNDDPVTSTIYNINDSEFINICLTHCINNLDYIKSSQLTLLKFLPNQLLTSEFELAIKLL